jgi:hypothetical protein
MKIHTILKLTATALCAVVLLAVRPGAVQAASCVTSGSESNLIFSGTGCTLSENTHGADGGSVEIATGSSITLTADASTRQMIGYVTSLRLWANSTIALSKSGIGARIGKGYIYVTDADGDGYRLNSGTDAVFSTTAVPGKVRRSTAASGFDANDAQACAANSTAYTCQVCTNGARVNVANGADTNNHCAAAGWNGCTNLCVKTTTNTGNCNGSAACATGTANVAAGNICSGGTESAGACAVGYTCNGNGQCSYTDIYGEHILW